MYRILLKLDPGYIYNLLFYHTSRYILTATHMQLFVAPTDTHAPKQFFICNSEFLAFIYYIVSIFFSSGTSILPIKRDIDNCWLTEFMTFVHYRAH